MGKVEVTFLALLCCFLQAYDTLSDPDSRALYDDFGDDGDQVRPQQNTSHAHTVTI